MIESEPEVTLASGERVLYATVDAVDALLNSGRGADLFEKL